MEYSFSKYLLAKQSVDDRALNQMVLDSLKSHLPNRPLRIIEVGAGIGTMLTRLMRWEILQQAHYVLVDEMPANIEMARAWIPEWAAQAGLQAERIGESGLRLFDARREVQVQLVCADVFDFIQTGPDPADLLIAHAFLDLLPMPESLSKLLPLTRELAWLTINFDGVTCLEPEIDHELDGRIERLYHETMDRRPTGGDSRAGRHLFTSLRMTHAQVLAAGASDWVVYATDGKYPAQEAYFLNFILHFFEQALTGHPALDGEAFRSWLNKRRSQIEQGDLVYIVHQMDLLARV